MILLKVTKHQRSLGLFLFACLEVLGTVNSCFLWKLPPCLLQHHLVGWRFWWHMCGPFFFPLPAALFYTVFCPRGFVFQRPSLEFWISFCYLIHSHSFKCGFSLQSDFVFLTPALTLHCIINFLLSLSPLEPWEFHCPFKLWFLTVYPHLFLVSDHKQIYKHTHQRQNPRLERLSLQPPPETGTCYPGHCVFPFFLHHSPPFFQAAPGLSLCRHLRLPSVLSVHAGTRFSWPF